MFNGFGVCLRRALLSLCAHRRPLVRSTSLRFLVSILDRFPSTQSDFDSMSLLLDIIEAVTSKAVHLNQPDAMTALYSVANESSPLTLRASGVDIDPPSSLSGLTAVVAGWHLGGRCARLCVYVRVCGDN